ncbi:MAG: NfeD family protein [Acidobacteriota bacterium]
MCHVVLLLPLLTLPVFWILPFALALPVYGMLVVASAIIYWQIMQAMRRPVQNGAEAMVGEIGVIIESQEKDLLVCVRSEIWHATCPTSLRQGDRVKAVAVAVAEHLTLQVQQLDVKSNDVFSGAEPILPVAN